MSILIEGMKMPTSCWRCFFYDEDFRWCCLTDGKHPDPENKDDVCPLIEIPSHGDLIERKVAYNSILNGMVMTGYQSRALDCISEFYVPTVIEGDEDD